MLEPIVRNAEKTLGRVDYELTEKRQKSREHSRSLFVVKEVKKGEVFTEKGDKSIRPGYDLKPQKNK
jgi:pseudaminic acid synthase